MGTIIVGAALLVIVGLIVRKMIKDKKAGKSSCGCNCAECHGGCSHSS
ncbi:MAG: FeoB-associated Cys-rich membrane protein [Lachnospiraceae bacterium]|nr:FeoB-associated Cys-rich membrane protein [Lachnospiraceae bacterium]